MAIFAIGWAEFFASRLLTAPALARARRSGAHALAATAAAA